MKHVVDARELICPLPVVNTKNEIENMEEGESVDVLVDNEIAVQNLSKFANVRGYGFSHEKTDDVNYQVTITVSAGNNMNLQKDLSKDIVCDMSPHNNDVARMDEYILNASNALKYTLEMYVKKNWEKP